MFRVGQKVVCIKDSPWLCPSTLEVVDGPAFKETLTIRGICPNGGLLFDKWDHRSPDGAPRGYKQDRFRPIVDRPTSIEFAYEILREETAPHTNEVPA